MQMNIAFNFRNIDRVASALMDVQKNCSSRLLTVSRMEEILSNAQEELGVPKSKMKGVKLIYTGAEPFPSSYRYVPESTHMQALHNGKEWVIKELHRGVCPDRRVNVSLILPQEAKDAVLSSFSCFMV